MEKRQKQRYVMYQRQRKEPLKEKLKSTKLYIFRFELYFVHLGNVFF